MYSLDRAKLEIVALLNAAMPEVQAKAEDLVKPPQADYGDLSFPCFGAAKALKKAPPAIAAELAAAAAPSGLIASISALGPYLNFKFDRAAFAASVVADVLTLPDHFGDAPSTGEKVMIEYFSANTHKEVHVGHLRNMALGLAIVNMARAAGQKVVPVTYIGDVGAHVAKCLWWFKERYESVIPEGQNAGKFLGMVYTEASRAVGGELPEDAGKSEEELEKIKLERKEAVSQVQRLLESQNPGWHRLWHETRDLSLAEIRKIGNEFGIEFERWYFESEVEEPGKDLVKEMMASGLATISQGATVVNLEDENLGVFLVLKSDGSSLYSTKELALARLKFAEYPDLTRSVNIVDLRQSMYFQQFFATLRKMGFDKPMKHLGYEFVTLPDGAMSSRKGNVITYEDLRDEVKRRTYEEARTRHAGWSEERLEANAWAVAEGAMKFWLLKQGIDRPIVFDIEQALAFEGFTGPYVQYAHARLASIMRKAGETDAASVRPDMVDDPAEFALMRLVADLPDVILNAARTHNPAAVAQYAFDLAEGVNAFYRDVPVLAEGVDAVDRARRLTLAAAAKAALARALALLGIKAPEEM
jgi:arginyl-tRNA synthetase